jgi:hypothetical protein
VACFRLLYETLEKCSCKINVLMCCVLTKWRLLRPCRHSDSLSPVPKRCTPGSIPGQVMWASWWTNDTGTGLPRVHKFPFWIFISPNDPYSLVILWPTLYNLNTDIVVKYQKENKGDAGSLQLVYNKNIRMPTASWYSILNTRPRTQRNTLPEKKNPRLKSGLQIDCNTADGWFHGQTSFNFTRT